MCLDTNNVLEDKGWWFCPDHVHVKMLVTQLCLTLQPPGARQAPLSMGFSRQEYWSGLPFPSPRDLPDPGIKPGLLHWQADSLLSEPPGLQGMHQGMHGHASGHDRMHQGMKMLTELGPLQSACRDPEMASGPGGAGKEWVWCLRQTRGLCHRSSSLSPRLLGDSAPRGILTQPRHVPGVSGKTVFISLMFSPISLSDSPFVQLCVCLSGSSNCE